jgi:flagellar hook assembly protein FlgD
MENHIYPLNIEEPTPLGQRSKKKKPTFKEWIKERKKIVILVCTVAFLSLAAVTIYATGLSDKLLGFTNMNFGTSDTSNSLESFSVSPLAIDPSKGEKILMQVKFTNSPSKYELFIAKDNVTSVKTITKAPPDTITTSFSANWDGTDNDEALVPAGKYFVKLNWSIGSLDHSKQAEVTVAPVLTEFNLGKTGAPGAQTEIKQTNFTYATEQHRTNISYKFNSLLPGMNALVEIFPQGSNTKVKSFSSTNKEGTFTWYGTKEDGVTLVNDGVYEVKMSGFANEKLTITADFVPEKEYEVTASVSPEKISKGNSINLKYTANGNFIPKSVVVKKEDGTEVFKKTFTSSQAQQKGSEQTFTWDGKNTSGSVVDSGKYKFAIETNSSTDCAYKVGTTNKTYAELNPKYCEMFDKKTVIKEVAFTIEGDAAPPPPPPPQEKAQCNNGSDDDTDGKIDYPNDPGCTSLDDTTENSDTGVSTPPPADNNPPSPPPTVKETKCDDGKTDYEDSDCKPPKDASIKITDVGVTSQKINPALNAVKIYYKLSDSANVKVEIKSAKGDLTIPLFEGKQEKQVGNFSVWWEGTIDNTATGQKVPDGTYTYKISATHLKYSSVKDSKEGTLTVDSTYNPGGLDFEDINNANLLGNTGEGTGQGTGQGTPSTPSQNNATVALQNSATGSTAGTGPGVVIYFLFPLFAYAYKKIKY